MSLTRLTSLAKSSIRMERTTMPSRCRIFSAMRTTFSGGGTEVDSSNAQRSLALVSPAPVYSAS